MIRGCSVFCIILLNSSAVLAQCPPEVPMAELLSRDPGEVVFSGVVTNIDRTTIAETVTFNVEWVWKGSVRTQTSIARPVPVAGGSEPHPISFELKNRYVVAAQRLTDKQQQNLHLSSSKERLGTDLCGSGSRPMSAAQNELARMGPGQAPEGQPAGITRIFPPVKIKDSAPIVPQGFVDVRGTVMLEITIDASGHVRDPKILRSIAGFDQAAIDSVMTWEYAPALLNGVPVPIQMTVTIPIVGGRSRPAQVR